ncbi:MAG: heme NO-binding domain-containing protein [Bdellovibrionales bacterium]|nr:heme NO-binding domain-containing protein [Bdellovibrionales bacterium]
MYGLVNKAVEGLVCDKFGQETWEKIRAKAGIVEEHFISNESYPDDITYRLVGAAHEVTGLPVPAILSAFGEYWVLETAQKGYGHLLKAGGNNVGEFLRNLPNFHARIILMYPKLQPPKFKVSDATEKSLILHYISDRPGLADFVVGLVTGLGKLFATPVQVEHIAKKAEGADHDEFRVSWS